MNFHIRGQLYPADYLGGVQVCRRALRDSGCLPRIGLDRMAMLTSRNAELTGGGLLALQLPNLAHALPSTLFCRPDSWRWTTVTLEPDKQAR